MKYEEKRKKLKKRPKNPDDVSGLFFGDEN
jgi:hypothetical protein